MAASELIAVRVTPQMKAAVRTLAQREHTTESALLKQMLDIMVRGVGNVDGSPLPEPNEPVGRGARLTVRLQPEDHRLLRERAAARAMPAATYLSMLARAHLRKLVPLPKRELEALMRCITELSAVGRNLNQIARAAKQGQRASGPSREDLRAILRACEGLRDHIRQLLETNLATWETGHDQTRG